MDAYPVLACQWLQPLHRAVEPTISHSDSEWQLLIVESFRRTAAPGFRHRRLRALSGSQFCAGHEARPRSVVAGELGEYLFQRRYQRRTLRIRPHRDPQELLDARQFEMAHDDAALPQCQRRLLGIALRMADEDEIGL